MGRCAQRTVRAGSGCGTERQRFESSRAPWSWDAEGLFTLETTITVDGMTAEEVYDFLVEPTDEAYQRWWPGVHLQLHLVTRATGHIGDVLYMDEYVGARRLRMHAEVVRAERPGLLVWQFKRIVRLPLRLSIVFTNTSAGVEVDHRVEAGSAGPGRVLDPLWRLYMTKSFAAALDEHVRTEFPLLRDRFRGSRST